MKTNKQKLNRFFKMAYVHQIPASLAFSNHWYEYIQVCSARLADKILDYYILSYENDGLPKHLPVRHKYGIKWI
jgi:hypothetical protein